MAKPASRVNSANKHCRLSVRLDARGHAARHAGRASSAEGLKEISPKRFRHDR